MSMEMRIHSDYPKYSPMGTTITTYKIVAHHCSIVVFGKFYSQRHQSSGLPEAYSHL